MAEVVELHGAHRWRGRFVVGLIAHDALKEDLLRLVRNHRSAFSRVALVATGTTGRLISQQLGLPVECVATGAAGGDLQIASRVADGAVDAVIFLEDPMTPYRHEPDLEPLLRVCDVHRVPVATNLAAAEILARFLAQRAMQRVGEE